MMSNMLILLAGLWTRKKILTNTGADADVAGRDEMQERYSSLFYIWIQRKRYQAYVCPTHRYCQSNIQQYLQVRHR